MIANNLHANGMMPGNMMSMSLNSSLSANMLNAQIANGSGNMFVADKIAKKNRDEKAKRLVTNRVTTRNLLDRIGPSKAVASKKA
ncbi:MAG: hypothetical protein JW841_14795 [Deltaproteobacteria bacterium]|nr:hypothetical protein [Deltaproteobacteria bacterium]